MSLLHWMPKSPLLERGRTSSRVQNFDGNTRRCARLLCRWILRARLEWKGPQAASLLRARADKKKRSKSVNVSAYLAKERDPCQIMRHGLHIGSISL